MLTCGSVGASCRGEKRNSAKRLRTPRQLSDGLSPGGVTFSNPHGWLHLDVTGSDGKVVNWAIEAGSPNSLLRRGLRRDDFPIGSELVIEVLNIPLETYPAAIRRVAGLIDDG